MDFFQRQDLLLRPFAEHIRAIPPGGEMVIAFEDAILTLTRTRPRKEGGKTRVDGTWRYYDRVHFVEARTGANDDKPRPALQP